jgi:acetyltransferase-like isoleucine patch superfamily enzyme
MRRPSLNHFLWLRGPLERARQWRLRRKGVRLGSDVDFSFSSTIEPGGAGGIVVGDQTTVSPLAIIDARTPDGSIAPIRIGSRCFIGAGALIVAGASIGDGSIVAGGAVVRNPVPADCIVAGNPARVVRRGIAVGPKGRLPGADETQRKTLGSDRI